MMSECANPFPVPTYHGLEWLDVELPTEVQPWPKFGEPFFCGTGRDECEISRQETRKYLAGKPWVWPSQVLYFFCDLHADADAFIRSLVASGGVERTGPSDTDLRLTDEGRTAQFLIGGDCFDKGPSNLRLLRVLHHTIALGARVQILAGNHDVRTLLGIACAGRKEPELAHLFVRMGRKTMTLLAEVHARYLAGTPFEGGRLSDAEARARLVPDETWYDAFPAVAGPRVPPKKLAKEVGRIREKVSELEMRIFELGLTMSQVHAAVEKCRELFLTPAGELAWFFDAMQLGWRAGSFLFVHAGVDDAMAELIQRDGVAGLNASFRALLADDLFELYHGPVGNVFRTKYRDVDYPLSDDGVSRLHRVGIYAVVHGHRNITRGQRLVARNGLLNFECDASVDRNTRRLEGLKLEGAAVTVFRPDGAVLGISTDYPYVKVFDPAVVCGMTTIV
jgi:hypothetical protein